jgi:predicted transcriptional regulator
MGERKRRSKKEIICEILNEALNGASKTKLMYRCNLNFERFNHYLEELLKGARMIRPDQQFKIETPHKFYNEKAVNRYSDAV